MPRKKQKTSHVQKESDRLFGLLSNYCGPGGAGSLRNKVDALCRKHDLWYHNIDRAGRYSYLSFNEADYKFLHELESLVPSSIPEYIIQQAALAYFKAKRLLASHDIGDVPEPNIAEILQYAKDSTKRAIDDSSLRGSKKQKFETPADAAPKAKKRVSPIGISVKKGDKRAKRRLFMNRTPPEVVINQFSNNMPQGETPVVPYKKAKYIQEDVITRQLKWKYESTTITTSTLNKWSFRCNSAYDPSMDDVTNTQGDFNNSTFNGWAQLARQFQFYRVIGNQIKVHFVKVHGIDVISGTDAAKTRGDLELAAAYKNPLVCGVAIDPANRWFTRDAKITDWKNYAYGRYNDMTFLAGNDPHAEISFKYSPEEWDAGIAVQQKEVMWCPLDKNPERQDVFTVYAQSLQGSAAAYPNPNYKIIIEMDAVIQFREWSANVRIDMYTPDNKGSVADDSVVYPSTSSTAAVDKDRNDITKVNNMDVSDSTTGGSGSGT